jgi:hypothetical protein
MVIPIFRVGRHFWRWLHTWFFGQAPQRPCLPPAPLPEPPGPLPPETKPQSPVPEMSHPLPITPLKDCSTMKSLFSRRQTARELRQEAAEQAYLRAHEAHLNNGEEVSVPDYIANYSKGLPHNDLGEVDAKAYRYLLRALTTGHPADFEAIPMGTPGPSGRKLTNPQAGLAFDLEGPDGQSLVIPPAPRIDSAENAAEMAELYWMALLRDVHFSDYETDAGVADAANSLSDQFSDFRGPKHNDRVIPANLFRGITPGDLKGPYLSQFLLKDIAYGTLTINQRQRTVLAKSDFMVDYDSWLDVQRGVDTSGSDRFDSTHRYLRNLRDLANYVHFDALYQAYLNACLILLDLKAPFDKGNPYSFSLTQSGFGTFGPTHVLTLVTEVATRALKAVWYQKWSVHRRLRPEVFGGRIHNHLTGAANYPMIHPEILDTSAGSVLDRIRYYNQNHYGYNTYLLPQAFSEGSPTHPAYGAGHATVAGACVTILKAFFDESYVLPKPVVASADGLSLLPYVGADANHLTVGGELNKLAANISIGRNGGGVHWRTDYTASIQLGEAIAIGILQEQKATFNEDHSFTLTKFDGTAIVI